MLAAAATLDLRRDLRIEIDLHDVRVETTLPDPGATIVNISRHGVLVATSAPAEIGAPIMLSLPVVGAVIAEIVWTKDGRVGCQFEDAIPLARYSELLLSIPRR